MTREWERLVASLREFMRDFGRHSRAVELDGVVAGVTPGVPNSSLPNSVIYEDEERLVAALPELAGMYDDAGVNAWTVWVPPDHERARAALAEAGHVLDAAPTAMIADLADVEPPRDDDLQPEPEPRAEQVGAINDRAFGTNGSFAAMMGQGALDPAHAYVVRVDGEPAGCLGTRDHEGDCGVYWVAVVPEARGRGITQALLRRALSDGRERGCDVSTLEATKMGRPVYERAGYRALGPIEMWERRKPPPAA
jgi:GNAT superfamily N-acetyltransferase